MSDIQLKSEITHLLKKSGYAKSKSMLCPIMRIISMRHKDLPMKQIYNVTKSVL